MGGLSAGGAAWFPHPSNHVALHALRPRLRFVLAVGFFTLLACAMTFPLARFASPVLPDSDDAYFSVWRIAWVSHQITRDPRSLFDANIYLPTKNTLAYSDAMLALGMMASPLIALGLHPAVVHNVLAIAGFATAGIGAFLLCHQLSRSTPAAVIGGIIFAFAPFRFAHIGHLELLWTAPMPLAVLVLHRALAQPQPVKHGLALGSLLALQVFCSVYYAAFLAVFLVAWTLLVLILRGTLNSRVLQVMLLGAALALCVVAPYGYAYAEARRELGPRTSDEVRRFSAVPSDYLRVSVESKRTRQARQNPTMRKPLSGAHGGCPCAGCDEASARLDRHPVRSIGLVDIRLVAGTERSELSGAARLRATVGRVTRASPVFLPAAPGAVRTRGDRVQQARREADDAWACGRCCGRCRRLPNRTGARRFTFEPPRSKHRQSTGG